MSRWRHVARDKRLDEAALIRLELLVGSKLVCFRVVIDFVGMVPFDLRTVILFVQLCFRLVAPAARSAQANGKSAGEKTESARLRFDLVLGILFHTATRFEAFGRIQDRTSNIASHYLILDKLFQSRTNVVVGR